MEKFTEFVATWGVHKIFVHSNIDYSRHEIIKTGYIAKIVNPYDENDCREIEFLSLDEFVATLQLKQSRAYIEIAPNI